MDFGEFFKATIFLFSRERRKLETWKRDICNAQKMSEKERSKY